MSKLIYCLIMGTMIGVSAAFVALSGYGVWFSIFRTKDMVEVRAIMVVAQDFYTRAVASWLLTASLYYVTHRAPVIHKRRLR